MEKFPIPQISKRKAIFLYVEKATVNREDSALQIKTTTGKIEIPCAQLTTLMLGPGTSITDHAIHICGEMGVTVIWVGEGGVRFYSQAQPIARSAKYIIQQAKLVSDPKTRLQIAKKMYQKRFPDEVVTASTMEKLRGAEGIRVRKAYIETSKKYNVPWKQRISKMSQIDPNDTINQAITMATSCLYGITHAAIVAVGASPALGFVHTGNSLSFVYDIADLYKTEIAVETAFKVISDPDNIPILDRQIRTTLREEFHKTKIIERIIKDINSLFNLSEDELTIDPLYLWVGNEGTLSMSGYNWG